MKPKEFHPNFEKMDQLSEKKVPFLFLVDFMMEKVDVFEKNEILNQFVNLIK